MNEFELVTIDIDELLNIPSHIERLSDLFIVTSAPNNVSDNLRAEFPQHILDKVQTVGQLKVYKVEHRRHLKIKPKFSGQKNMVIIGVM